MFGLKFILQTYNMSNSDLANKLEINRANISMWIKNNDIPPVRVTELKKVFPNIPSELFSKDLKASEKILVQEIYFTETDEVEVVEYPAWDDEGYEYTKTQVVSQHEGVIGHLRGEYDRQILLESYESLIFDEGGDFQLNEKLLKRFLNILQDSRDSEQFLLLKMMFYFLQPYNKDFGFGSDPDLSPTVKNAKMYKEFGELLEKYGFINQF
ncbi:hypothetical protein J7E73_10650 [Paenibacillus albidus]|uniref:hypothetical protein n=1 Tax=Paenibacillus albidus TaxID=2041023 RepID=UPI001BE99C62|nr:hypothetical protein [Paenibacillus albidus]MBT2289583.1 hypothetical protein [Paenibacillus albidus]